MHAFLGKIGRFDSALPPEQLPGVKKTSFILPYRGGAIWFEHLDGMYQYTQLAREKLGRDSEEFLQPSGTSLMAVVLFQTTVTDELIDDLVRCLSGPEKVFRRVCFIGVNGRARRAISKRLTPNASFPYCFLNDMEKAKEWLLP